MSDQATRNSGQTIGSNAFQRTLDTAGLSLGFNTNLEQQGPSGTGVRESPHQEARSTSAVLGRRTRSEELLHVGQV